jgi:hypothetical protein
MSMDYCLTCVSVGMASGVLGCTLVALTVNLVRKIVYKILSV